MIDLVVSKRKKPIIWFLEECLTSSLDTTISHYKDVHQVFNYKTLLFFFRDQTDRNNTLQLKVYYLSFYLSNLYNLDINLSSFIVCGGEEGFTIKCQCLNLFKKNISLEKKLNLESSKLYKDLIQCVHIFL